ncbi:MAG TPA: tetratricopeptide repeat protein, partial [Phycisphaerales bacterium]|nr:tetratricopeptide repeat protein [Phycisphaerales bacterium]
TAPFPLEHQHWLGQCSQAEYMRQRQFALIATKPALRNKQLAALETGKADELSADEVVLLAMIRAAQGNNDKAVELLTRAAGDKDVLALSALAGLLMSTEMYKEAEPVVRRLTAALADQREKMHAEMVDRVRRGFVRSLPVEHQLRVTDAMLSDLADKWTLGSGWASDEGGGRAMGYLRARLTLATICAETGRMDEALAIWRELAPRPEAPDVERLTMLGDTAVHHKQDDAAYEFYKQAMKGAARLAGDPLLQQVYGSTMSYYGEEAGVDKAFNSIVESFSKRDGLAELYDFLRDTAQTARARRLLDEYKLTDKLTPIYTQRVADAAAAFKTSPDGPMRASPAYFAQVCKLAELHDLAGDWAGALKVYESYLGDFPDELALLTMLGEVAEARLKTDEAIAWEKKVLDCKARLAQQARAWSQRELTVTPAIPQSLAARMAAWEWSSRWGNRGYGGYGGSGNAELDRWPSLMRLAQLELAAKNTVAAADAMQRAVAESGPSRDEVVGEAISLIEQRQLTAQMLPVLRTLAVYAPANERVQLAFARSLEQNNRKELALEVCNRLLRKGVSDLAVLAELRRHVQTLNPQSAPAEATVSSLEKQVAADPANLKARLRLAKAYYYSLSLDKAETLLTALAKDAPTLEDVHDLLVEIYTLTDGGDKLTAALRTQIERTSDEGKRRLTRWRLADQLLAAGKNEEALAIVKDLGDPRDPRSYVRIGALLYYFGKTDDALAAIEQSAKSGQGARGYRSEGNAQFTIAQTLALRGEFAKAADRVMSAVDEESQKSVQYGAAGAGGGAERTPAFATFEPVFALYPQLADEVSKRVGERHAAQPTDVQAARLLMSLHRSLGRPDKADALLEVLAKDESADQGLIAERIDLAVRQRDFGRAIELAQKFIAQAPKPQLPPGMPAQYAGYALLQAPRTTMLCKLGDVYWTKGDKDKAFETYGQIVDKKIDETRQAYAAICLMRGRVDEARRLVEEALGEQKVKSPNLQSFKAFLLVLEGKTGDAVDVLEAAASTAGGEQADQFMYDGGGSPVNTFTGIAQRAGMTDRVAAFIEQQIKKHPEDW